MKSVPKQAIELIRGDREASHGTSFCIGIAGDEAFYVTCAHVIQEVLDPPPKRAALQGINVKVGGAQGRVVFTGGEDCDLVVLSVPRKDSDVRTPLTLVSEVKEREIFTAFGFQLLGKAHRVKKVEGLIASRTWEGIHHRIDCSELEATKGEFRKGMSGGPVFNEQGKVVGMLTQSDGEKIGSSLDIRQALQALVPDLPVSNALTSKPLEPFSDNNVGKSDALISLKKTKERELKVPSVVSSMEPPEPGQEHNSPGVKIVFALSLIVIPVLIVLYFRFVSPSQGTVKTFTDGGLEISMVWCPPGTFLMGSPISEKERRDNETQHEVTLTQGFWLAQTEVTQAQWQAVMGNNPSEFKGEDLPVENVSWQDVQAFITTLNEKMGNQTYRLPTEAEWEYACRAGTTTPFNTGENLTTDQANYDGNYPYANHEKGIYREKTTPVKTFPANGWGLYDMHGNVWEWCQDWYSSNAAGPQQDPSGPDSGQYRVLRGGGWIARGRHCRSADRNGLTPDYRNRLTGFRLARGQEAL